MENILEQEQEMIVNRLQKKLQRLQHPKTTSPTLNYDSRCESSADEMSITASTDTIQKYMELKKQYEDQKCLIDNLHAQINELTLRIEQLQTDNMTLRNASVGLINVMNLPDHNEVERSH
jgi:uncharacterized coiled-coil protein SlyX